MDREAAGSGSIYVTRIRPITSVVGHLLPTDRGRRNGKSPESSSALLTSALCPPRTSHHSHVLSDHQAAPPSTLLSVCSCRDQVTGSLNLGSPGCGPPPSMATHSSGKAATHECLVTKRVGKPHWNSGEWFANLKRKDTGWGYSIVFVLFKPERLSSDP